MPPVFYYDVIERRVDREEGRKDPIERKIVTRYFTEFDPDPDTVMDRLFDNVGDGLPPIFYEIEEVGGLDYKIPSRVGIRPLAITIQPGNWGDRIDWTAQWEVLPEKQEPLELLGLKLYDWTKTVADGQQVAEYLFGHRIFGTSQDFAGTYRPLRTRKKVYTYRGTVAGELNYDTVRSNINANTSVVGFSYSYRPIQNVTSVNIVMEESASQDGSN